MSDPFIQHHLDKPTGLDSDPQESAEWCDAFHAVLQAAGADRARELMDMLSALARNPSVGWQPARAVRPMSIRYRPRSSLRSRAISRSRNGWPR